MTKTLTEQWKDMELGQELYYVRSNYNNIFIGLPYGINMMRVIDNGCFDVDSVKEVLAPVPSYDEFVQQRDFVKDHQKVLIENMNLKLKIERLEKQLAKTKTKEYIVKVDWFSPDPVGFLSEKQTQKMFGDWKKKKEDK